MAVVDIGLPDLTLSEIALATIHRRIHRSCRSLSYGGRCGLFFGGCGGRSGKRCSGDRYGSGGGTYEETFLGVTLFFFVRHFCSDGL